VFFGNAKPSSVYRALKALRTHYIFFGGLVEKKWIFIR